MKLSLFTPTHDPQFLLDAYSSLRLQQEQDWEWVIVPSKTYLTFPSQLTQDPRIRISPPADLYNIGALKRHACDLCRGDVFIELDHDDVLMPRTALTAVKRQFEQGAGFVYSDAAVFRYRPKQSRVFEPYWYSVNHGWQTYDVTCYGRRLVACRTFPITPRSLCEVYYAPDHVRAWSREAYYAAGGHNRELSVTDDHELVIKTYLKGFEFRHAGGCQYLYRMSRGNTVGVRNRQIQTLTQRHRRQYLDLLIREWASRHRHDTVDLTRLIQSGWQAERDLPRGFGRDCLGAITAHNVLQWLQPEDVTHFMNAAYDALLPGGYLELIVPDAATGAGWIDPGYRSRFSELSCSPYTRRDVARMNPHVRCRFQQVQVTTMFPSDWHRKQKLRYLKFHLVALKGQHNPGLSHI